MTGGLSVPASIPSPGQGVWYLGPLPIRAYALCILAGIILAVWLGERRWRARGGPPGIVYDVSIWAVPLGIIGGRLYHLITSPDAYFGKGGHPLQALEIWKGGLGIWGAIALGGLGAWIGCRRAGVRLPVFADAVAPGVLFAQAIGRVGNYFNQELFGGPTSMPWGLTIDPEHRPAGFANVSTYQPTFLYELLWDAGGAALLLWLDRRLKLGHSRVFWLYVVVYTLGRTWIEALRIDPAHSFLGLRLNVWTSGVVFLAGVVMFVVVGRRHPGREADVYRPGRGPGQEVDATTSPSHDTERARPPAG